MNFELRTESPRQGAFTLHSSFFRSSALISHSESMLHSGKNSKSMLHEGQRFRIDAAQCTCERPICLLILASGTTSHRSTGSTPNAACVPVESCFGYHTTMFVLLDSSKLHSCEYSSVQFPTEIAEDTPNRKKFTQFNFGFSIS